MLEADIISFAVCVIMFSITIYCVRQSEFIWRKHKKDSKQKEEEFLNLAKEIAEKEGR